MVPAAPAPTAANESRQASERCEHWSYAWPGATYRQVASAIGYADPSVAHRAVQRALDEERSRISDIREEYRDLQVARCERLIRGHWTRALAGNDHATSAIVKLMDRQAKLARVGRADEDRRVAGAARPAWRRLLDDLRGMHSEDVEKRDEEIAPAGGACSPSAPATATARTASS